MHAFWGESVESLVVYLHHALNQATLWMHRISSPFVMRRASCLECDLLCGVLLFASTVEHDRFHWTREGKDVATLPMYNHLCLLLSELLLFTVVIEIHSLGGVALESGELNAH